MGKSDLPDMYAQAPWHAQGIHIRQITNAYVTYIHILCNNPGMLKIWPHLLEISLLYIGKNSPFDYDI